MRSRTCAAVASMVRNGTLPAPSRNKQNVSDDFIAAGEYLIKEKYTQRILAISEA